MSLRTNFLLPFRTITQPPSSQTTTQSNLDRHRAIITKLEILKHFHHRTFSFPSTGQSTQPQTTQPTTQGNILANCHIASQVTVTTTDEKLSPKRLRLLTFFGNFLLKITLDYSVSCHVANKSLLFYRLW